MPPTRHPQPRHAAASSVTWVRCIHSASSIAVTAARKLGDIAVEHPKVKSHFGFVPIPYLRGVCGEVGLLVADRLDRPARRSVV